MAEGPPPPPRRSPLPPTVWGKGRPLGSEGKAAGQGVSIPWHRAVEEPLSSSTGPVSPSFISQRLLVLSPYLLKNFL